MNKVIVGSPAIDQKYQVRNSCVDRSMKEKRLYTHEVGAGNKRVIKNRAVSNRVVSKSDFGRQGGKRHLCLLKSKHS